LAEMNKNETHLTYFDVKVKVQVKRSLCLTKHYAMKAYWGSGGIAPRILDLGTRWSWVVSFTPRPLCHQGQSPRRPLVTRLDGPQCRLDAVAKRKIPSPRLESNPRSPIFQPIAQWYTTELSRLPDPHVSKLNVRYSFYSFKACLKILHELCGL
jgi:hypothetical protein